MLRFLQSRHETVPPGHDSVDHFELGATLICRVFQPTLTQKQHTVPDLCRQRHRRAIVILSFTERNRQNICDCQAVLRTQKSKVIFDLMGLLFRLQRSQHIMADRVTAETQQRVMPD